MSNRIKFILVVAIVFCSTASFAKLNRPRELQIGVINHATVLPFTGKFGVWNQPLHAGLSLGGNWFYKSNKHSYKYWNLTLNGFVHQFLYKGLEIYGTWNYRFAFSNYLHLTYQVGFGYFQRFNEVDNFQKVDGVYKQVGKLSPPSAMFSTSVQLNWYPKHFFKSGSIYTSYQVWAFYKYSEPVPILPSNALQVGISYPFSKLFE